MKPTREQLSVLARVEHGEAVTAVQIAEGDRFETRTVVSYQWSRDGDAVVTHRTVLAPEASRTGNARLDYRVEMFRIQPDGSVSRL